MIAKCFKARFMTERGPKEKGEIVSNI